MYSKDRRKIYLGLISITGNRKFRKKTALCSQEKQNSHDQNNTEKKRQPKELRK